MKDTPAKNNMNIALLNIPFAIVGIAAAIVPLVVAMRQQARSSTTQETAAQVEAWPVSPDEREFERAA